MKIFTVTGYKGGIGKSTTAIHIAACFHQKGKTILIDGDPNRTAIAWSQRGSLPFEVVDERQAMKLISGNDFVIIDTPARPDSSDLKELGKGCDLLILPTIPDIVSLEPMLQTAQDLEDAAYRALVTIVPPKPNKEGETIKQELMDEGFPVFDTTIRRTVDFSKAAYSGITIRDIKSPQARAAWKDYQSLGKEILEAVT